MLWWPAFALMLFVFPTGRLWNAWARTVWLCVCAMALTFFPPWLLFVPAGIPMDYGVTQVPSYFYVGHAGRAWSGGCRPGGSPVLVFLLVSIVLIARVVEASPGARRRLVPLFAVFIAIDTFKDLYISSMCSAESRFTRAGSGMSGTSRSGSRRRRRRSVWG